MSFDYTGLQNTAYNLIAKFGTDWTIRRIVKNTYNPATNTATVASTTDYTVKAYKSEYVEKQVDGENIQKGDILLVVAAKDLVITPRVSDQVLQGSSVYQIQDVKPLNPATTNLYYKLQLRQ